MKFFVALGSAHTGFLSSFLVSQAAAIAGVLMYVKGDARGQSLDPVNPKPFNVECSNLTGMIIFGSNTNTQILVKKYTEGYVPGTQT